MMYKLFYTLGLAAAIAGPAPAQTVDRQEAVTIGCDTPVGHICYFSIVDAKGSTIAHLTLPGGGRVKPNIPPQKGVSYVVTVDQDFTNDRTCLAATKAQRFCKKATLKPGFND
jgi:hypothetical protein